MAYCKFSTNITSTGRWFPAVTSIPTISSLKNPAIRHLIRLRDNRFRQRERLVVVDGVREVSRGLDAGLRLNALYVGQEVSESTNALVRRAAGAAVLVSEAVLAKISFGEHHRDAVAVFEQPTKTLEAITLRSPAMVLVLDGLEKPGNVGAMFRTADAVGADAVVLCQTACDAFNPSVIRASLTTVFSVPFAQVDRATTMAWLASQQIQPITARVDGEQTIWEANFRQSIAIVVGAEAEGLGGAWRGEIAGGGFAIMPQAVCIPMQGQADSLNASVSAALLMFEARRQRQVR